MYIYIYIQSSNKIFGISVLREFNTRCLLVVTVVDPRKDFTSEGQGRDLDVLLLDVKLW